MESICVIEKNGRRRDVVMAIEYADNEYVHGYCYEHGKIKIDSQTGHPKSYTCSLNVDSYHSYANKEYLRIIQEQEYNRRYVKK